jgi:hypothetical protein
MSTKRLIVAALVLAGLGGLLWWSNKQEAAKTAAGDTKAPPKILTLTEGDITGLEIEHRGEPAMVLAKDEAGKWKIAAPQALAADQGMVGGVTGAVSSLSSDHVVDENPTNLASYGLDPAVISLKLTMKDGATHRLRIGEETPDKSGVYVTRDGDKRLFTIASYTKTSFDKRIKDLREKHLLVFDTEKVSRVELNVAGKGALEFRRSGENQWQILKPRPMRADGFQVEDLIRTIHNAEMDVEVGDKKAASGFAAGRPHATARVTGSEGVMTLEVRLNASDYYARSSAMPGFYKVSESTGKALDKSLEDFQNKKLFDFGFDEVSRIEYSNKSEMRVIEKSGENWTSGGKTMDNISVQNFIDKLRDLTGTKVTTGAFGTPDIRLTVVSKNGARTEKVEIAAQGSDFVARRENEPSLYPLNASVIAELRGAAAGVREPPPASDKANK